MSKEKGQKNREKFASWVAEMRAKESPNWTDYWHGNTLSPKKIANELGFGSSAFKKSRNEKLFKMLEALKAELATDGIYHGGKVTLPVVDEVVDIKNANDEGIKDSAKVRELKRINYRLQTENSKLCAELARLSEFKEVLIEMGLWK